MNATASNEHEGEGARRQRRRFSIAALAVAIAAGDFLVGLAVGRSGRPVDSPACRRWIVAAAAEARLEAADGRDRRAREFFADTALDASLNYGYFVEGPHGKKGRRIDAPSPCFVEIVPPSR